ncbi:Na+/H+ antiporter NhaA [Aliamphritea ceti]|uniref:Na+/H+ antiporter NhaA n=1 Tax=Aliamphritea ceti TaxID=1524258 RepID=UPI0021C42F67|nr:Na+/H+ antiporter NhaA [Aliamphritea ceti]
MTTLRKFLQREAAGGILLMFATAVALVIANSPLAEYYDLLIHLIAGVSLGNFSIEKPLLLWINDGLMAVFFFLVGLELKREILEGELAKPSLVALPFAGAVGGMLVPALIYLSFTSSSPEFTAGWAIPAATDIAFALGVLALLGKSVPASIKLFLVTLAIIDDIGAILIIAVFYTESIDPVALAVVAGCVVLLCALNYRGISDIPAYMVVGLILWTALLKSGVHATLAGVVLAFFIPMRDSKNRRHSPVRHLEHSLHPTVAFMILPVFAFANAGLNLSTISIESLMHPVTLGIAAGLFVGKQVGVFGFSYLVVRFTRIELPKGMDLLSLYGVSILCGVGFTMSLFIGSLAFEESGINMLIDERLGILLASVLSAITGFLVIKLAMRRSKVAKSEERRRRLAEKQG